MTGALRLLAIVSALASLIALGLSAMASDDMGRRSEAQALQLLVFAWLLLSIAAPIAATLLGRRWPPAATLSYLPMVIVGAFAIVRLIRF